MFLTKTRLNQVSHHPNPKFSVRSLLELVTLDDLDLIKYTHRKLRTVLDIDRYRRIGRYLKHDPRSLFPFDTVVARGKTKHNKSSNMLIVDTTCDVIGDCNVNDNHFLAINFPDLWNAV